MPLVRMQLAGAEGPWELVFVDDDPSISHINGYQCLTFSQFLHYPAKTRHMVLAVANGAIRERLAVRCSGEGIGFYEARAANVIQLDEVQIGPGAVLSPFVSLTSNIRIGQHFHANLYSYVEHDCVIGDYATFAPGVQCNGNVHVEDRAFIGAGAILRPGRPGDPLVIGQDAVVGMGAVVTRSVPPGATVVGNPARLLHKK